METCQRAYLWARGGHPVQLPSSVVAEDSPVEVNLLKPLRFSTLLRRTLTAMPWRRLGFPRGGGREWVRGKERSSQPRGTHPSPPSMDEEGPLHDRRCPVPAGKSRALHGWETGIAVLGDDSHAAKPVLSTGGGIE
jgi:hypothetical protein